MRLRLAHACGGYMFTRDLVAVYHSPDAACHAQSHPAGEAGNPARRPPSVPSCTEGGGRRRRIPGHWAGLRDHTPHRMGAPS